MLGGGDRGLEERANRAQRRERLHQIRRHLREMEDQLRGLDEHLRHPKFDWSFYDHDYKSLEPHYHRRHREAVLEMAPMTRVRSSTLPILLIYAELPA